MGPLQMSMDPLHVVQIIEQRGGLPAVQFPIAQLLMQLMLKPIR